MLITLHLYEAQIGGYGCNYMDEAIVFATLLVALALFITGKVRYDIVALGALLALTVLRIVPASDAFQGFGHPAVVTVGAVLVLSKVLENSGVIDVLGGWYSRVGERMTTQVMSLSGLAAVLSAFMNNVGALSLLMPLAVRVANSARRPYSPYLMPLSFASLLGGLATLIGTPPNIIISTFRQEAVGRPFMMFDFTPVGALVAISGLLFIGFVGWRLIPSRRPQTSMSDAINIADYMVEVRATENSRFVGRPVRDLEDAVGEDVAIAGLIRRGVGYGAPSSYQIIDVGDVLIIEVAPEDLAAVMNQTGFALEIFRDLRSDVAQTVEAEDVLLLETVVMRNGLADGNTVRNLNMHTAFGINLLGISRRGTVLASRLSQVVLQVGDVLLLQGRREVVQAALPQLGLLPLAHRELGVDQRRRMLVPVATFAAALLLTIFGVVPIHISLPGAVVVLLVSRFLSLQAAYQAVNWPIIVLLGAMIPVGEALETSGGALRIASLVADLGEALPPWSMIAIVLVITMLLSDWINNATAVILMAPVGMGVAGAIGASVDPFLMAVAIGGSSAFLSPIGHQSNTIVMGPGGYRFGDYWRMGLPLDIIIIAVATPLIVWFWPLGA